MSAHPTSSGAGWFVILYLTGLRRGGELWIAITPLVWVLVGAATLIAAAQRPLPTDSSAIMRRAAVLGCAAVCAGLFLVTIRVGSLSLFQIFYAFVPGAAAIRAGYRAMIVANLFAVIAIALGCANARPPLPRHWFGFPASFSALLCWRLPSWSRSISRPRPSSRVHSISLACSMCRLLRAHAGASTSAMSQIGSLTRSRSMRCWSRWSGKGRRSTDIPACSRQAGICSTPRMPPTNNTWRPGSPAASSRVFAASTSRWAPGRLPNNEPEGCAQTGKPSRSGSPSMNRLPAALDAGTTIFLGDFRRCRSTWRRLASTS